MTQTWRLLKYETHEASYQMAIDEAMLHFCSEERLNPTLRLYGWTRPAFSFGYFQNIEEEVDLEACKKSNLDLVRRPTGGGVVIHGWDLTYAVVVGLDNPLMPKALVESYKLISHCLIESLKGLGIKAYTSIGASDSPMNVCLAKSSLYDVMIDGRKVAGAAQRRRKGVLLNQGYISLDMPPSSIVALGSKDPNLTEIVGQRSTAVNSNLAFKVEAEGFSGVVAEGFRRALGVQLIEDKLSAAEYDLVAQLQLKYLSDTWNFKF